MCPATPVHAIKANTKRRLWHNRPCHSSPGTIQNAHKHVKGIPKFTEDTYCPIADHCPTCTCAKLARATPGKHGLDLCTMPYNVISLDFSFSGTVSKDTSRREDVLGINGEVGWILAQDQFSKIIHVDARKNKAAPAKWLDQFLEQYAPPGMQTKICFA